MLAERVERWRREWYQGEFEKGMEKGVREGTDRLRGLVVELAEIKFGEGTAFEVSGLLRQIASRRRIAEVADAVMGCKTPEDLIARGEALIDTPSLSFSRDSGGSGRWPSDWHARSSVRNGPWNCLC